MKRAILLLLCAALLLLAGCSQEPAEPQIVDTIETAFATYYEMSDGTWMADGISYQYRFEITGRMPNAAVDSTFVYLSNLGNITFDRAWKAAGFSSLLADYFSPREAILVDWK